MTRILSMNELYYYIETYFSFNFISISMHRILRPGGIWVNLGPLLYHYSDVSGEGSIEPTYEDLLLIIRACGFQILVSFVHSSRKYRMFFVQFAITNTSDNRKLKFYRKMTPVSRQSMHKTHDRCNRANT